MASNSVDLHLNIQDSLSKTVNKGTKSASAFNDKMGEVNKTAGKLKEKMGGVTDMLSGAKQQMGKFGNILQRVLPPFGIIFGGGFIADTVKEVFDMNQAMADTAYQMGHGAQGAKQLESAVFGVMQTTGIANEEAQKFVKSLTELRVPLQHLEGLAVASADFSEMTGVSADATSRLAGELMRVGRVGADATKEVMANMAIVQRASGMSASEMQNLTESMQETTMLLTQMGKQGEEITNFNKGVSQLAGAFASAGVEAQKATQFIDELLDPSKVEDNAYLYSQLGVSMQEAFSGDVSPEKLIPKFQQLGEKMQNMSGPAAAAMAENLGMSARTLRQFAEIDTSKQQEMMQMMNEEGLSAQEALRQLNEEQDRGTRNFSEVINKLKGQLQPLIADFLVPFVNKISELATSDKLMGIFQKVGGVIKKVSGMFNPAVFIAAGAVIFLLVRKLKKRFFSMATETGEKMNEAFGSSITGAVKKSSKQMSTQFNKKISDIGTNLKSTFSGSSMVENTEKTYANLEGQLQATQTLKKENKLAYNTHIEQLKAERSQLKTRTDYLDKVNKTSIEQAEFNRELRRQTEIENELNVQRTRRNKDQRNFHNYEQKQLKNLSDEQLRGRKQELQQQKEIEVQQIEAGKRRERELLDQNKSLNNRAKELESMKQEGNLTTEQLKELQEANNWLDKNEKEISQISEQRKEANDNIRETNKYERQLNKTYEERYKARAKGRGLDTEAGASPIKSFQGIIAKGTERLASVGRNVRALGQKAMFKAGQKITSAGRFLQDNVFSKRALKKNMGAVLKSGAKGMTSGMKGLGSIMKKLSIPMLLLGTVMKALQPVFDALMPIFNQLKDIVMSLLNKLMKALLPPLLRILAALLPIFAVLVNKLLPPVLIILGKTLTILGKIFNWLAGELPAQIMELGMRIKAAINPLKSFEDLRKANASELESVRNNALAKVGQELAAAGENVAKTGKDLWENKVITDKQVGKLQDGLNKTADEIKEGKIQLNKSGSSAGTGKRTTTTTEWTPAMLTAGKKGIAVQERAKKTVTTEEKQTQAQEKTAENTGKMAEELAKLNKKNEEQIEKANANKSRYFGRAGASGASGNASNIASRSIGTG